MDPCWRSHFRHSSYQEPTSDSSAGVGISDDEDQFGSACANKISGMWSDPLHRSLRWTHVGLPATGEILYLANAVTGIGSLSKDQPGLTPQDLQVRIKDIYG